MRGMHTLRHTLAASRCNQHSIHMRSIHWVQVVGNEDMFTEWKGEMEMMAG